MYHFVGIVGTNSKRSTNRMLLQYMKRTFVEAASIELIEINDVPLFNKPQDGVIPERVRVIAKKIEEADGVIISTPEYDHSVPASLSNVLAWLSYHIFPLLDKPVMVTGASYGTLGSSRAQAQLRQMLDAPEIKARIMPSSEFLLGHSLAAFNSDGNLVDKRQVRKLKGLFEDFLVFVDISKQLTHAHRAKVAEVKKFSWEDI